MSPASSPRRLPTDGTAWRRIRRRALAAAMKVERETGTPTRCHICAGQVEWDRAGRSDPMAPELDHLTPASLGGSDDPGNLAWVHAACNQKKGGRPRAGAGVPEDRRDPEAPPTSLADDPSVIRGPVTCGRWTLYRDGRGKHWAAPNDPSARAEAAYRSGTIWSPCVGPIVDGIHSWRDDEDLWEKRQAAYRRSTAIR